MYLCDKALVRGLTLGHSSHFAKPLQVVWKNCTGFSDRNTIMIDDLPSNFLLNPQSGLVIHRYADHDTDKSADEELRLLSKYLSKISDVDDFRKLHHALWRLYV
jgi:NLI interacting factor-like phosphatase